MTHLRRLALSLGVVCLLYLTGAMWQNPHPPRALLVVLTIGNLGWCVFALAEVLLPNKSQDTYE